MQIRRRDPSFPVTVGHLQYQVALPDAEPQNILERIVWHKEREIAQLRQQTPLAQLKNQMAAAPPIRDFEAALRSTPIRPALIAEVKKASPSRGVIRRDFDPVAIAQAYQRGGATCLSILTDAAFFQGGFANLQAIRWVVDLPLLCKEFILYPYQIYLARLHGADAVLLIAAILTDQDLRYFLKITQSLGMAALIEVHTLAELDRVLALPGVTLIGINNRNLENFTVNLETTCQLLALRGTQLDDRQISVVSESGLSRREDLKQVAAAGAAAVLVGEFLIKQTDLAQATRQLLPVP